MAKLKIFSKAFKSLKKGQKTTHMPPELRFDGYHHMPDFLHRSGKRECKYPGCKSETQVSEVQLHEVQRKLVPFCK